MYKHILSNSYIHRIGILSKIVLFFFFSIHIYLIVWLLMNNFLLVFIYNLLVLMTKNYLYCITRFLYITVKVAKME